MINVNGFPKSSYHAFRFLRETGSEEIFACFSGEPREEHGVLASQEGNELRLLVWNYRQPETEGVPLEFTIPELASSTGSIERILPGHGSAYETWLDLGRPDFLNREAFDALDAASRTEVQPLSGAEPVSIPSGTAALLKFRLS